MFSTADGAIVFVAGLLLLAALGAWIEVWSRVPDERPTVVCCF